MTALHTTDDLLRAARDNQEFREAFRREILTDDLLNLPRRFEDFASETSKNINALTVSVADNSRNIEALTLSVAELTQDVTRMSISHRAEHDSFHRFRGSYAIDAARNNKRNIVGLFADARGVNRFRLKTLTEEECDDLYDDNFDAIALLHTEGNVSRTFPEGDIIAEASHRRSRDTIFYIAVEASYTVNADDVSRATDHAKILRKVSGYEAFAVVAGVEVNPRIGELYRQRIISDLTEYLESDRDDVAYWFRLTDHSLEPAAPR